MPDRLQRVNLMTEIEKQQAMNEALEHQRFGRLDDAEDIYRRIISADPNQAGILNNLANVLKDSGRIEEAVDLCREALLLEPANAQIHSSLCYKLHFHPDYDRAGLIPGAIANGTAGMADPPPGHDNDRTPVRRLRIGYVSPDFYGHAECFFVLPLLESHDRQQLEVHCYSSVRRPDKATEMIKSWRDVWHDVRALSDDQLAKKSAGMGSIS